MFDTPNDQVDSTTVASAVDDSDSNISPIPADDMPDDTVDDAANNENVEIPDSVIAKNNEGSTDLIFAENDGHKFSLCSGKARRDEEPGRGSGKLILSSFVKLFVKLRLLTGLPTTQHACFPKIIRLQSLPNLPKKRMFQSKNCARFIKR